ncbi:MAG: hypothetical protein L6455_07780 [Kiritimatiellae bacterium]|nr:hypothetical protein [Kiritimatiellia bacterium]
MNTIDMSQSYGLGGTRSSVLYSRSMFLYGNDDCDTYAHEAGHLLGLKDRYKDVTDRNGFPISVPVSDDWKENIMATGSKVQEINFTDWVTSIKNGMIIGPSGF